MKAGYLIMVCVTDSFVALVVAGGLAKGKTGLPSKREPDFYVTKDKFG